MGKGLIAAALALALAGCTSTGGSFCRVMTGTDGKSILTVTPNDVEAVSDQLATGLVTVLETGEKECGWTP